jgi:rfaE bifunctional protein kinase chain/domain
MARFRDVRIGVLGDFCVDAYWELDADSKEISLETGKTVQHVSRQRYTPGGAGNVMLNLAALGVRHMRVYGVVGNDLFGRELARMLQTLGADTRGLLVQRETWDTPVYGKPLIAGEEQQRLDFGLYNQLQDDTWRALFASLCDARDDVDCLIVNQQLPHGWCDESRAAPLRDELLAHWSQRHLIDTRHYVRSFAGAALKLNQHEATRLLQADDDDIARALSDAEALDMARRLAALSSEAQFMTRSERGIVACTPHEVIAVPGVSISGPIDVVGAGDTATAMLAACRATGVPALQAATFANLASSITVQKLHQTGTANHDEMLTAAAKLSYIYHPTLAEEPRRARYFQSSDVEVIEPRESGLLPRIAVFDHDGTISTLRQGWEAVMEPVMLRAILGAQYQTAPTALFQQAQARVQRYIEQSTGIQTIAQMDALVTMVNEFGLAPAQERLDAWGYKQVYNAALMEMVNDRLQRLERGELAASDFIMKGALEFLRALRQAGLTLYLVSGTDEADAMHEAARLGYADLFNGGIYGAKPGSRADTKDTILKSLLASVAETNTQGEAASAPFLVFGDGPVEIKLGRYYGGISVGVASHEERRFGLNLTKRRRLIRAGAHLLAPDFSQWAQLMRCLQSRTA